MSKRIVFCLVCLGLAAVGLSMERGHRAAPASAEASPLASASVLATAAAAPAESPNKCETEKLAVALAALQQARETPGATEQKTRARSLDLKFAPDEEAASTLLREEMRTFVELLGKYRAGALSHGQLLEELDKKDASTALEMQRALRPGRYALWEEARRPMKDGFLEIIGDKT